MADGKQNVAVAGRTDNLGAPAAGSLSAGPDAVARAMRRRGEESRFWWLVPTIYIIFLMLPIYWLANMSLKTNSGDHLGAFSLWPRDPTLRQLYHVIFTDPVVVYGLHQLDHLCGDEHGDFDHGRACLPPTRSRATASSATSICSFGCSPTAWRRPRSSRCPSSSCIRLGRPH
jgi:hypothetical protein